MLQNKLIKKLLCCWQTYFFPLYKKVVELASFRSYLIPSSCKLWSTWVLKYFYIHNKTTYILSTTYPSRPNSSIISVKPLEIPSFLQLAPDFSIPFLPFLWVRVYFCIRIRHLKTASSLCVSFPLTHQLPESTCVGGSSLSAAPTSKYSRQNPEFSRSRFSGISWVTEEMWCEILD